jgi:lipopolysaccharide export LptBFGC system permease protein LptF
MFWKYKWRKETRRKIKEYLQLAKQINDRYETKTRTRADGTAPTTEESDKAFNEYNEHMRPVMNELSHLRQKELLYKVDNSPLEVPDEYWFDTKDPYRKILSPKGIAWAEHELKKIRNAEIEFWFKLVVPVAALIISVVALIRSGHAH